MSYTEFEEYRDRVPNLYVKKVLVELWKTETQHCLAIFDVICTQNVSFADANVVTT